MEGRGLRGKVLAGIVLLAAAAASAQGQPEAKHGLCYTTPAAVWDEAFPLGNGLLGALVWGDGTLLRISLDRTDLWDLRPVPEFYSEEYSYETMRKWVREGRLKDLHRLYDDPYYNPGPTKIPAGRIELNLGKDLLFREATLDLAEAIATLRFEGGPSIRILVHARMPVGLIEVRPFQPLGVNLLAPPFAADQRVAPVHPFIHNRCLAGPSFLSALALQHGQGIPPRASLPVSPGGGFVPGSCYREGGKRTLPLSSSPEINDNRLKAWFPSITNFDLAFIRWAFASAAELALEIFSTAFCLQNSFHCNGDQSDRGYSNFRYRPFTLEGNFAAAAAVQEMLLQS